MEYLLLEAVVVTVQFVSTGVVIGGQEIDWNSYEGVIGEDEGRPTGLCISASVVALLELDLIWEMLIGSIRRVKTVTYGRLQEEDS